MKTDSQSGALTRLLWGKPKARLERRLAQMGMGILVGLRDSRISLEQAREDLFNLRVYRAVRRLRLSPALVEFLEWGMELEDVAAHAPDGLEDSYRAMEELLLRVQGRSGRRTGHKRVARGRKVQG